MENQQEKYEALIYRLRQMEPVLKNPGQLTNNIRNNIAHCPQQTRKKRYRIRLFKISSGMVASVLLGWMLWETNRQPNLQLGPPVKQIFDRTVTLKRHKPSYYTKQQEKYLYYSQLKKELAKRKQTNQ